MRAVTVDPAASERLVLKEVEAPTPRPNEALVRIRAFSLNRGEVRRAYASTRPLREIGWDLAGTVDTPAADGSGPAAAARVVGFKGSGAWAELACVPTNALAELPDVVTFAQAATLPVAGLSALHGVEKGESLLGHRILVTGASGGVGNFACQLGRLAGAEVVGLVRQERHVEAVRSAGAMEVVVSDTGAAARRQGPYRLVLDSVGGEVLSNVVKMLEPDGICVTLGASAEPEAKIDIPSFFATGGLRLYGLILFHEFKRQPASMGLTRLARMVAAGGLVPAIAIEAPWTEVARIASELVARSYPGKAVLHV